MREWFLRERRSEFNNTSGGKSTEKYTQVKVPLPSKKCSVSRVKVLVQKTT